jgi:DnaK suppressor protein
MSHKQVSSQPTDRSKTAALLSPKQLEQLRGALGAKKAELLSACEEHAEEAAEAEVMPGDVVDLAEGVIEDRQRAALDEHDRALLAEVERALEKIDAGTYGVSEKSGRPIPFARLSVLPWTRYDVEDAAGLERVPS